MTTPCPVCKYADTEIVSTQDHKAITSYKCKRCGEFTISSNAEAKAKNSEHNMQLSAWIRERNETNVEIPIITGDFLKEVLANLPRYSANEKQQKLLQALERKTKYPGQVLPLTLELDVPLAWATNSQELAFYVDSLANRGLIENNVKTNLRFVKISSTGWEYLESITSAATKSAQAFVAMSFAADLRPVYDNAIAPAIESTGYKPYRVDSSPHLDRIDAKIIAEIRSSKFIIADVTQQKAGVYYEAGFAHGFGLPVVWSVREDDLEAVHFDTRQYSHIVWKDEATLKQKLEEVILATIGRHNTI